MWNCPKCHMLVDHEPHYGCEGEGFKSGVRGESEARYSMVRAMAYAGHLSNYTLTTDPRFTGSTLVIHRDGSVFLTHSSFFVGWQDQEVEDADPMAGRYIIVLALHQNPKAWPYSALERWQSLNKENAQCFTTIASHVADSMKR